MVIRDIVGLAKSGEKTPPAKKRKDRPLGKSKVHPDLEAAMRGGGGKCVGCNNPQGVTGGSQSDFREDQSDFRAEKMDKGLPLFDKKKKNGK